jgi:hypothetical protein
MSERRCHYCGIEITPETGERVDDFGLPEVQVLSCKKGYGCRK